MISTLLLSVGLMLAPPIELEKHDAHGLVPGRQFILHTVQDTLSNCQGSGESIIKTGTFHDLSNQPYSTYRIDDLRVSEFTFTSQATDSLIFTASVTAGGDHSGYRRVCLDKGFSGSIYAMAKLKIAQSRNDDKQVDIWPKYDPDDKVQNSLLLIFGGAAIGGIGGLIYGMNYGDMNAFGAGYAYMAVGTAFGLVVGIYLTVDYLIF